MEPCFFCGIRFPVKFNPRIASLLSLLAYFFCSCTHTDKKPELECASPCAHSRYCTDSSDVRKMVIGPTTICSLNSCSMVYHAVHLPSLMQESFEQGSDLGQAFSALTSSSLLVITWLWQACATLHPPTKQSPLFLTAGSCLSPLFQLQAGCPGLRLAYTHVLVDGFQPCNTLPFFHPSLSPNF